MIIISRLKPYLKWRYFLYFFAFIAAWPCVFPFMGWLPDMKLNMMVLAVLSVFTAFSSSGSRIPSAISNIIYLQLGTFIIFYVLHGDSSYITRCVILITTFALLKIQMCHPQTEIIDTNVSFLTIQALMGGIGFVLTLAGILHPISTFIEFDGHVGTFYGLYTCNALYDGMVRVAGFFDEPGAFANWGIMALLFNKLFIENKTVEKVLIVGLISTLSMAFFIQVAIYAFLFYRQRMGKLITYGLLFFILLLIIASLTPDLNEAIFGRFTVNEQTGQLNGDNRTVHALSCLAYWKSSPLIGVGTRNLITISQMKGEFVGANPLTFFATDGIIGQIVLWIPTFYLLSLGGKNKKYKNAAIIMLFGYLQRPYDPTEIWYSLVVFTFILEAYREIYMYGDNCRSNISRTNFIPFKKTIGYE